jgi:hypothetical protein
MNLILFALQGRRIKIWLQGFGNSFAQIHKSDEHNFRTKKSIQTIFQIHQT